MRLVSDGVIEKAKAGDRDATSDVIRAIEPIVRSFFRSKLGGDAVTEDLTQNTLIRLLRGLPDLRSNAALKSFSMKAALYELQDHYRSTGRSREVVFDPVLPPLEPSTSPDELDAQIDLDTVLSVLSHKSRRVLELRAYGYRYKEIAQMTDSSEAAVKMQVKRAFERIRKVLTVIIVVLATGLAHPPHQWPVTFGASETALSIVIRTPGSPEAVLSYG